MKVNINIEVEKNLRTKLKMLALKKDITTRDLIIKTLEDKINCEENK